MYIYIYIYIYTCMYVYVYMCIDICVYIYIYTHIHIYIYIYTTHIAAPPADAGPLHCGLAAGLASGVHQGGFRLYIYIYICIHIYVSLSLYIYIYIYIHISVSQWMCDCYVCIAKPPFTTPNPPTNILDFTGLDSSIILI